MMIKPQTIQSPASLQAGATQALKPDLSNGNNNRRYLENH